MVVFFFIPDVKVLDVDVLVGRRLPLAPQQEALLGRRLCGGGEGGEGRAVRMEEVLHLLAGCGLIPVQRWIRWRCGEWRRGESVNV